MSETEGCTCGADEYPWPVQHLVPCPFAPAPAGDPGGERACYCRGGSVHPQCPTHAAAWLAKMRAAGDSGGERG